MKKYIEMSPEELASEKETLRKEYVKWQSKGLKLDMSRGSSSTYLCLCLIFSMVSH